MAVVRTTKGWYNAESMEWLSRKPLYALLLLSEKPARWTAWQVAALLGAMVVGTGLGWAGGRPVRSRTILARGWRGVGSAAGVLPGRLGVARSTAAWPVFGPVSRPWGAWSGACWPWRCRRRNGGAGVVGLAAAQAMLWACWPAAHAPTVSPEGYHPTSPAPLANPGAPAGCSPLTAVSASRRNGRRPVWSRTAARPDLFWRLSKHHAGRPTSPGDLRVLLRSSTLPRPLWCGHAGGGSAPPVAPALSGWASYCWKTPRLR
jgi:hypothetical protein